MAVGEAGGRRGAGGGGVGLSMGGQGGHNATLSTTTFTKGELEEVHTIKINQEN